MIFGTLLSPSLRSRPVQWLASSNSGVLSFLLLEYISGCSEFSDGEDFDVPVQSVQTDQSDRRDNNDDRIVLSHRQLNGFSLSIYESYSFVCPDMISQQVNLAIEKKIKNQNDDETKYKNKRKRHRDNTPTINEIRNQVSEAKRRIAENSDIKDEERERLTCIARD